ncbi:RluA family pseudouridine synthase [Sporolituus thermophilus]|uniref:Pseudouridine synthase n=1 Tax=Sporolituus thermophilus DSM 23256 TaxID=1123285 RepID=A0A1G7P5G1_9FIRM|nr:RluA family pseudouridine synthase [Sporolituus thermophilus]SDF81461.1 23S rRNA pseudouridine1911/1915/1917 synthase [Sporolituus thermophilus DSM 23256]
MFKLTVPFATTATSVRDFLKSAGISLTQWRKIKRQGQVLINGHPVNSFQTPVSPGDEIIIDYGDESRITPLKMPLHIVYEDDFLLIVNKPAGLLVHPTTAPAEPTLAHGILYYLQSKGAFGAFHPIHRLDRNTSGLVAIAKHPHIQHALSGGGAKGLKRLYLAVVTGIPSPLIGKIDAPVGRQPNSIIKRMVRADGQPAITLYRVLSTFSTASLVELELLTGRTHQIRVHMSHIGHPLLGDDLYGGATDLIRRQALHAASLSFRHPATGKVLMLTSPLAPDLTDLIRLLRQKSKFCE